MRKQYYISESTFLKFCITLYHDGTQVDRVEKWAGDELNDYLEDIESQGYTQGYSKEEVDKAERKFKYLRDNLIEGV